MVVAFRAICVAFFGGLVDTSFCRLVICNFKSLFSKAIFSSSLVPLVALCFSAMCMTCAHHLSAGLVSSAITSSSLSWTGFGKLLMTPCHHMASCAGLMSGLEPVISIQRASRLFLDRYTVPHPFLVLSYLGPENRTFEGMFLFVTSRSLIGI